MTDSLPTPWWDTYLVAFDLETTSPDPEVARIVTAHVSLVGPAGGADGRTLVVDPGVPIPDEAAAIHGYTTARAQAEGMERSFGIGALYGLLRKLAAMHPVVAFNATYDFTVLDRECRRLDLPPLRPPVVLDPFVMDRAIVGHRDARRTLGEVCAEYGVELTSAHDAAADALAAVELARAIGRRFRDFLPADPLVMRDMLARWSTLAPSSKPQTPEQEAARRAYLLRSGAGANPEWPVQPLAHPGAWS